MVESHTMSDTAASVRRTKPSKSAVCVRARASLGLCLRVRVPARASARAAGRARAILVKGQTGQSNPGQTPGGLKWIDATLVKPRAGSNWSIELVKSNAGQAQGRSGRSGQSLGLGFRV